jgi:hypothetical protein
MDKGYAYVQFQHLAVELGVGRIFVLVVRRSSSGKWGSALVGESWNVRTVDLTGSAGC